MKATGIAPSGFNLLKLSAVRALVAWRGFPAILQIFFLALFLGLAVLGWGLYAPEGVNSKLYAKCNLVNLAIWALWWPAIIWITLLLGRIWCVVCPLVWVSSLCERLARRLRLPSARLPQWLAWGGLAVCLFALLQLLVPGINLHRTPAYTSVFLWTSLGLAIVSGLAWRDRAFCRGFCPVAPLLSAYGRGGMVAMRPRMPAKTTAAGECSSLLRPAQLDSSKDCLVCGDCVKAGYDMQLLLRPPFSAADAREAMPGWPLTLFVMMVSGFVIYELCGVWKMAQAIFLWAPQAASAGLGLEPSAAGWLQGLWTIGVVPLLLWMVLGGATLAAGGARSLGEAWRRLALPLAVVVAAGHMAKALEKVSSWSGYLPYALNDPRGITTVQAVTAQTTAAPVPWMSGPALSVIAMLLVILAVGFGVREARLADPQGYRARALAVALLGGFFLVLTFGWGGWVG